MQSVCVFCGAQSGNCDSYVAAAAELGTAIAAEGQTLVYGGGSVGMMGAIADAVLNSSGKVIGVIPEALANVELMHPSVKDMRIVSDMHARKALMYELSDSFIALPGGFGTLEELFEVLCWGKLNFHQSPVALLNHDGFYDGLIELIDEMVRRDFLSGNSRALLSVVNDVQEAQTWLVEQTSPTSNRISNP